MSEDETQRMRGRISHNDVLNQAQIAKRNFGNKQHKLKQRMYLHSVGKIPKYDRLSLSDRFDSEATELHLEEAFLYENAAELMEIRDQFAVIEDDFGQALNELMKDGERSPSFINLVRSCQKYDDPDSIQMHSNKSAETYFYFMRRGVSEDDAGAYSFAIAFYTGGYSAALNADATILARRLVKQDHLDVDQTKVGGRGAMILYYLTRGLSHIDFYWGQVVRYINLEPEDLKDYHPGEIITWLQFSSSDKGEDDMSHFTNRNTIFSGL